MRARTAARQATRCSAVDGGGGCLAGTRSRQRLLALAVVRRTRQRAVALDRRAAVTGPPQVVDLAAMRGHLAPRTCAVPVAHLDRPAQRTAEEPGLADLDHPIGTVEHDALDHRPADHRGQLAGGDQGARCQHAHISERSVADEDGEQGRGALAADRRGRRPRGQLDECVMASLPWRARQVSRRRGVAVFGLGCRPIGLEQLALDRAQRPGQGGLGQGRELTLEEPGAAQPVVETDTAVLPIGPRLLLVVLRAGLATPVGHRPSEVRPAHRAGLTDQEVLRLRERTGGRRPVQPCEQPGTSGRDRARRQRRRGGRHRPKTARQAHLRVGVGHRAVAPIGQPGCGVQVAGGGEGPSRVCGRHQPGPSGSDAGIGTAQLVERVGELGIAEILRIEPQGLVHPCVQCSEHLFAA